MLNLFLRVLNLSLIGSYSVLVVLLARLVLQKSPKWCSYLLWGVVFIRLILPVFPESDFSLIPSGLRIPELSSEIKAGEVGTEGTTGQFLEGSTTSQENLQSDKAAQSDGMSDTFKNNATASEIDSILQNDKTGIEAQGTVQNDRMNPEADSTIPKEILSAEEGIMRGTVWYVLAYTWLAGVVCFGSYYIYSYMRFRGQVRGAVRASDGVYEMKGIHISCVLGIIKPAIYLSGELDEESRRVVLCHEQVHLKRRDYLVKPLALAICCVHWFNPLVWLAFYFMSRDCEMSCDEKVVSILGEESKKIYSFALLDEARKGQRISKKRENICAVLSFGEDNIKSRIKHVLYYKRASAWVIGCTLIVLAVVMIGLCSNARQNHETIDEERQYWVKDCDITDSQKRPRDVLETWATALWEKDGKVLHDLSYDQEEFKEWDLMTVDAKGDVVFADASHWPTKDDYEIYYQKGEEDVIIRYWMRNSVPEVFPCDEQVKLIKEGDLYYVEHVSFQSYEVIDTLEEFIAAYGPKQEQGNAVADRISHIAELPYFMWTSTTGYDKNHMRYIYDHMTAGTDPDYYDAYKDPVSAAKIMLNLGDGVGEVTQYLYQTKSRQETDVVSNTQSVTVLGEGSVVNVSYTFKEDGSVIQIPMVLAEETMGLWALSAGDLTGAEHQTYGALSADADFLARSVKKEIAYAENARIQVSDYGIYRLDSKGLENIYTYRFPVEVPFCYDSREQLLYFPIDSLYKGYDQDWTADCICEMDVVSGGWRYVPLEEASKLGAGGSFAVNNGYIYIYGTKYLWSDAKAVWNDKKTAELSDREKDAYGSYLREYVLAHPGEMIKAGSRYSDRTEVYIDMDGDGKAEDITIDGLDQLNYGYTEDYYIKTGEFVTERFGSNFYNEIWVFSPDGEHIFLVLYEDGPSNDPETIFFRYEDGALLEAGNIGHDIYNLEIQNGIIYATRRVDVMQTDWIKVQYTVNTRGDIVEMPQRIYEFANRNEVYLTKELRLYTEPAGTESFVVTPQTGIFTQVTGEEWNWVCLETEGGQTGWFEVKNFHMVSEDAAVWDFFDELSMVD